MKVILTSLIFLFAGTGILKAQASCNYLGVTDWHVRADDGVLVTTLTNWSLDTADLSAFPTDLYVYRSTEGRVGAETDLISIVKVIAGVNAPILLPPTSSFEIATIPVDTANCLYPYTEVDVLIDFGLTDCRLRNNDVKFFFPTSTTVCNLEPAFGLVPTLRLAVDEMDTIGPDRDTFRLPVYGRDFPELVAYELQLGLVGGTGAGFVAFDFDLDLGQGRAGYGLRDNNTQMVVLDLLFSSASVDTLVEEFKLGSIIFTTPDPGETLYVGNKNLRNRPSVIVMAGGVEVFVRCEPVRLGPNDVSFGGRLVAPDGSPLPGFTAQVAISGDTLLSVTDAAGNYTFSLAPGSEVGDLSLRILPPAGVAPNGNISVLDRLIMMRHLLGINLLEGAAFIAADLNESGAIEMMDLVQLQRIHLGRVEPPSPTTTFRFLNDDLRFGGDWIGFPAGAETDFTVARLGDVNSSGF